VVAALVSADAALPPADVEPRDVAMVVDKSTPRREPADGHGWYDLGFSMEMWRRPCRRMRLAAVNGRCRESSGGGAVRIDRIEKFKRCHRMGDPIR
jgi:hypothetical protein